MTLQKINVGAVAGDGTGDPLRTAFEKTNAAIDVLSNFQAPTKAEIGLGEVDNTSDEDKPVSTAQQEALDLKADLTDVLGAHPGLRASTAYLPVTIAISSSQTTMSANTICFLPFYLPGRTINRIGVEVQNLGASGFIQLGLYSSLDGAPHQLLVDGGTAEVIGDGFVEVEISDFKMPYEYVWAAINTVGTISLTAGTAANQWVLGAGSSFRTTYRGLAGAQAFGTLPATAPAANPAPMPPAIYVKKV